MVDTRAELSGALIQSSTSEAPQRVSGLLMETGVSYNKLRLHRMGYFADLMSASGEIGDSIRPLLKHPS